MAPHYQRTRFLLSGIDGDAGRRFRRSEIDNWHFCRSICLLARSFVCAASNLTLLFRLRRSSRFKRNFATPISRRIRALREPLLISEWAASLLARCQCGEKRRRQSDEIKGHVAPRFKSRWSFCFTCFSSPGELDPFQNMCRSNSIRVYVLNLGAQMEVSP